MKVKQFGICSGLNESIATRIKYYGHNIRFVPYKVKQPRTNTIVIIFVPDSLINESKATQNKYTCNAHNICSGLLLNESKAFRIKNNGHNICSGLLIK